jgi:hypothetical protein
MRSARSVLGLSVLGSVTLLACGGASGGADGEMISLSSCVPSTTTLASDQSMASMAGSYRVVLVGADTRMVQGEMTLSEQPANLRVLQDARTPLGGSIDLDLTAVGAQPVRDLGSIDPAEPGVLVIESDGADGREILLRLGSENNRRDVFQFDGAHAVLSVQNIVGDAFVGRWRSGVRSVRTEGHFCAVLSS